MLHVVLMIERRLGARRGTLAVPLALASASAAAVAAGALLFLR